MRTIFIKILLITGFSVFLFAGNSYAQQRVPVYYTVKPQEGLYRVAVNNQATMEEIRRWNNLPSDNLSIGQRLIVGYKESTEESNTEPVREKESGTSYDAGNKPKYYTVKPKEGLYRVAINNNVTMAEIRSWNNLTSDNLSAGQKLIVGYEISAPDNLVEEDINDDQARYEDALASGNKAFDEQRYEDAKKSFETAIVIYPKSYIAKKRIQEIDDILEEQKALELKETERTKVTVKDDTRKEPEKIEKKEKTDVEEYESITSSKKEQVENDDLFYDTKDTSSNNIYPEGGYYYPSNYSMDYYPGFDDDPSEFNYAGTILNYPGNYTGINDNYYP